MGKLDGKVAVVTGAAAGNGLGASMVLARHGAHVILTDINNKVFESADSIKNEGLKASGFIMDVCSADSVNRVAKQVIKEFGKADILVNNAGVCYLVKFLEMSNETRDKIFKVNIEGVWNCTKTFLPYMIERNYGKIVNIASVTGPIVADPGETAYAITKGAVCGFTKALAVEFAKNNITVNAICPGYIRTPMAEQGASETNPENPEEVLKNIAAGIPMGRLGKITELGELVGFLASDESSYITGTQVVIDGGSTLPETFGAMGVY